jgi:miniconductance mechanosensitive channel
MLENVKEWFAGLGLTETQEAFVVPAALLVGVFLIALLAYFLAKTIIVKAVARFAERTTTQWDNILVKRKVFVHLAYLAPVLVIWFSSAVITSNPTAAALIRRVCEACMIVLALMAVTALLGAIEEIYSHFKIATRVPIKGYIQVVRILLAIAGTIFMLSVTMDKSPWIFLSGMGALGAILLLIFKDPIMGLVAGVQLVSNDMVRKGDWIQMPKYGADGDVIEIALTTLKVCNWDKTITTIPTIALISDSFINWRGMEESGGRRIKRSILIDINSIRFSTPQMIEKFSRIHLLKDYITQKQQELTAYNDAQGVDDSVTVNGRRMTNIGTFRAYLVAYLRQHPKIHQEMTFLIRQLPSTVTGVPIEIYVFSNDQGWVNYEAIQSDIFDHLFGCLSEFELRAFQQPSGYEIRAGIETLTRTIDNSIKLRTDAPPR